MPSVSSQYTSSKFIKIYPDSSRFIQIYKQVIRGLRGLDNFMMKKKQETRHMIHHIRKLMKSNTIFRKGVAKSGSSYFS